MPQLCTPEYFKDQFVKAAKEDASRDPVISACIDAATAEIVDYCNQPLLEEERTYSFKGNGNDYKVVPYVNISETIGDLQERDKPSDAYAASTDTATAVQMENGVWYLYNENGFSRSTYYSVTLTVGYADADIPANLKQVCAERAYELYLESSQTTTTNRFGVSSIAVSSDGKTVTTTYKPLSESHTKRLKKFRRLPV